MIVTRIFHLRDRRLVIVHLASFAWDFTLGTRVKLIQRDTEIQGRQIGSGNHEGHATVTLALMGIWEDSINALQKMEASGQPISIELA